MCLYMKDKPAQAGSSTIAALQQRWREVVGEASKVVIIGVRPNDQDHHLWDAVAETHATIAFVGDEEVINEWADARRRGRPTAVLGSRFADALPQVIGALT
jgi:hypothetical protein